MAAPGLGDYFRLVGVIPASRQADGAGSGVVGGRSSVCRAMLCFVVVVLTAITPDIDVGISSGWQD
jgi:hypothetical protein